MRFAFSLALALAALAAAPSVAADREGWINVMRDGVPMVDGSGVAQRVARSAGAFEAIVLEGPTALEVTIGAGPSIEVEADDNLLSRIVTEIDGGILHIDTRGSFRTRREPVVRVTVPALARVRTRGSGDARISGVAGGALHILLQGSGAIVVDGRAAKVDADLYGSGSIDLTRLAAPQFAVSLYGSGDVRVHATEDLSAIVYGSRQIAYSGDPARLEQRVLGTGEIRHVGR